MSTRIMIGNNNSNNKKKLFSGITKKSPTNIIFQTESEKGIGHVLDNNEHNTPKEKTKINNVNFGDGIGQHPQEQSTRILFQNVNGLELSTTAHTLL